MDNVTRLLEETQQLLECFSSGTLSPVSSCSVSDFEGASFVDDVDVGGEMEEFQKLLKESETGGVIRFIEEKWGVSTGSFCPVLALHELIEAKIEDVEVFKALLRAGCDPLSENGAGKSALTALLDGRGVADPLISENCLISVLLGEWELRRAATGSIRVFNLIHGRNYKALLAFLSRHADPTSLLSRAEPKYAGISPLHEIAALNDVNTLRRLLKDFPGLDLNVKAIGSGNTLLHEATHLSAAEMVVFLLESGLIRSDVKNAAGKIPAHLATEKIQVLMEIASKPKTRKPLSSKRTADLFVQTTRSASSESLSREDRKLKQIIGFLDQIDKHSSNESLTTPQMTTATTNTSAPLFDLENILQRESTTGRTILHRYARKDQADRLIKFLKSHETEVDVKALFKTIDNSGHTPLHEAALEGSVDVAKILLFGFDPKVDSQEDNFLFTDPSVAAELTGDTPLHVAASMGHFEIVQLLLSVGANCEARNIEGKRPIDMTRSKQVRKLLTPAVSDGDSNVAVVIGNVSTEKSAEPALKRGPGRPRKYPREDEHVKKPKSSKTTTRCKESKETKQTTHPKDRILPYNNGPPPTLNVPLKEIFNDEIECVLLVRLMSDWFVLEEQFLKIVGYFNDRRKEPSLLLNAQQLFTELSVLDRQRIRELPRVGKLIDFLQAKATDSCRLIPKTMFLRFLADEFKFNFSGPFGYIDIERLLLHDDCTRVVVCHSGKGVPLKLLKYQQQQQQQQMDHSDYSDRSRIKMIEEQSKSPKVFSM
jgi:ankyrin repeat protein